MESDPFDCLTITLMRIDPTLGLLSAWHLRHDVSLDLIRAFCEMNEPAEQETPSQNRGQGVQADANGVKTYSINSLDQLINVFEAAKR